MGVDRVGMIPIEQWRQEQSATGQSAFADVLAVDRRYEIDGGGFQAHRTEGGRWELWAWMGKAGHEVTRTGFEIDAGGQLYDRLFDTAAGEMLVLVPARFRVTDLRPVTMELYETMREELERLRGKAVG